MTPSKATKDLLTLTMRDEHKIIVPLSDIHKKLPYYSRVHPLLTEPSIVDMEAGIFSYSASLVQKKNKIKNKKKKKVLKKLCQVKQRRLRQMLLTKQITKENEEKLSTFAIFVL